MAPELVQGLVQDWAPVWAREPVQETVQEQGLAQEREPVQAMVRDLGLAQDSAREMVLAPEPDLEQALETERVPDSGLARERD
jgi:hypothetical protein